MGDDDNTYDQCNRGNDDDILYEHFNPTLTEDHVVTDYNDSIPPDIYGETANTDYTLYKDVNGIIEDRNIIDDLNQNICNILQIYNFMYYLEIDVTNIYCKYNLIYCFNSIIKRLRNKKSMNILLLDGENITHNSKLNIISRLAGNKAQHKNEILNLFRNRIRLGGRLRVTSEYDNHCIVYIQKTTGSSNVCSNSNIIYVNIIHSNLCKEIDDYLLIMLYNYLNLYNYKFNILSGDYYSFLPKRLYRRSFIIAELCYLGDIETNPCYSLEIKHYLTHVNTHPNNLGHLLYTEFDTDKCSIIELLDATTHIDPKDRLHIYATFSRYLRHKLFDCERVSDSYDSYDQNISINCTDNTNKKNYIRTTYNLHNDVSESLVRRELSRFLSHIPRIPRIPRHHDLRNTKWEDRGQQRIERKKIEEKQLKDRRRKLREQKLEQQRIELKKRLLNK